MTRIVDLLAGAGALALACLVSSTSFAADGPEAAKTRSAVPASVKQQGLNVGYADYPPDQYTESNGQPVGWVVDLLKEVGDVMGVKVNFSLVASFQSLLPGLQARKYDVAAGGFSITEERKKAFDFVSYFNSGNSVVVKAGAKPVLPDAMCGHTAAIALGSFFANVVNSFSQKCVEGGKPAITLLTFPTQEAVLVGLDSGRADFTIGSLSANSYLTKQTNGRYVVSGEPFFRTTAGFAFDKSGAAIRDSVAAAMNELVRNGTYAKIQEKWGLVGGAVTQAVVNP